jgi:arylformamidase
MSVGSNFIDISPCLTAETPVWPGDTPLSRQVLTSISNGSNIDLSTLKTTVHIGAHADAPKHYHASGVSIDLVAIDPYIGDCVVVHLKGVGLIEPKHCHDVIKSGLKRVLFRTDSFKHDGLFQESFTSFSPDAIDSLGKAGFILIGIDTPSVDPFHSKDLPSHQMLYKHKIVNIEGLDLSNAPAGTYEFIGVPLKLKGFDASPIRAVLRKLPQS